MNTTEYPNIDTWNRENPEDAYVYSDGKNMIINIEKIMPMSLSRMSEEDQKKITLLKTFAIDRKLFYKKTDVICQYIDYYVEFFDDDKELPLAILSLKKMIDSSTNSMTKIEFMKTLVRKLFSETSIKKNVYRLVETNYKLDVTIDTKTGREFNGPYDFTNDEAKILLAISVVMKFVIPIVTQYISTNTIYSDDELNILPTDVFVEIVYRMGDYYGVLADKVLVKLYMFTETKIFKHAGLHKLLWNQQCALRGLTENMHVDTILIKHILGNNMFKFNFSDSIISFLKSIVEKQLICTINILKYKANPVRVDGNKDFNGLTGIDKLEQSMSKIDESSVIRCACSLEYLLDKLEKEFGPIDDDEHQYYFDNFLTISDYHNMLLNYYYVKEFSGFTELKNASTDQRIDLLIWAKRKMERDGCKELQHLISSNIKGRMTTRLLQNSKFLGKYENTSTYKDMMEHTYKCLNGVYDDAILEVISTAINNSFTYVEYHDQEKTGEVIEFTEDIIADEILTFIDNI